MDYLKMSSWEEIQLYPCGSLGKPGLLQQPISLWSALFCAAQGLLALDVAGTLWGETKFYKTPYNLFFPPILFSYLFCQYFLLLSFFFFFSDHYTASPHFLN